LDRPGRRHSSVVRQTYACRIKVEPFTIAVDEEILTDLRERIARTRWPDHIPGSGWQYGADVEYLRSLLASWAEFDWRQQEEELNRLAHYRADIDGLRIHFVHERGEGPAPLPILLTHGFPSSFVEYLDLLPLLTDPAAHGGHAEDAFDVIIPSMPGYGFSDPLTEPSLETTVADLWSRLMREGLRYERFGAHGSDVGSGVTIELGLRHPEQLVGVHFSAFYLYPPPEPWPEAVQKFMDWAARRSAEDGAYSRMQSTKPQTVAYGLTDSPAGMAAWIVDLFRSFSDTGGDIESAISRERILANLTVWWVNATIGAAMRGYYDFGHFSETHPPGTRVQVPAGFAVFADSYRPGGLRTPHDLAEHFFDIARWTEMPRGGHFAALEAPQLLADEIREFFRPLR
jgi:pimeloyl-ACP methyl ester carboxylesterase